MEVEQYYEDTFGQNDCQAEGNSMLKWRSFSEEVGDSNAGLSTEFDCNICLDAVQDPVVTLCGHLYCWPCIYKWLHCQSESAENYDLQQQQQQPQCPVCKAKVSQDTLVPLFGRGQTETTRFCRSKPPNLGITIPRRPLAYGFDSPRLTPTSSSSRAPRHIYNPHIRPSQRYYSESVAYPAPPSIGPSGMTTNMFVPLPGTFGELIHPGVFGTSMGNMLTYSNSYHHLAMNASPRVRRHVIQSDRSLSRIFLFLLCCAFLCLFLF